jgi:hypothetical protein
MAIGKLSKSFKKVVVQSENQPLAITNLAFAHEFTSEGENVIEFQNLNTPNDWIVSGRTNPTSAEIINANLRFFKNQIVLTSSSKGIIQPSQYTVTSSSIIFRTFVSEIDETFEVQVLGATTLSTTLVDGKPLREEGDLAAGAQDFIIGRAVPINPEQIVVFRNGELQKRNDSNLPLAPGADEAENGYYMLEENNTGVSSVIRFNEVFNYNTEILVISVGSFVEKPAVSMLQEIEKVASQVDKLIPVVANLSSLPQSQFQISPNNVDLTQFGNTVRKGIGQLGDFVYSPALTLVQFQGLRDDTWVAVDGANITGSDLSNLSGYTILPTMVGWYVKINN